MTKTTDIYGFLEDVISVGRQRAEKNKEKHDKERWKQLALGNHSEATIQSGLMCGDIANLETYTLIEKFIKYFQDHADENGLLTYNENWSNHFSTAEKRKE